MSTEEIWKPVRGYEGLYEVSNLGRVKSLGRFNNYKRWLKERIRKLRLDKYGYLEIQLSKEGKSTCYKVHRLVYEAFNGEIPQGMQINHIDEDKKNNRLENLNLMTPKENINWGTHNARSAAARRGRKGKFNTKCSKPVAQYTKEGILIKVWPSTREVGRNGFDYSNVASCCRNCHNRKGNNIYKGFIWKYI